MVRDWIHRLAHEVAPNHDKYDFWGGVILVLFSGVAIWFSIIREDVTSTHVVAAIATITAFVAIYQLRHPETETQHLRPAVRQGFHRLEGQSQVDFGLRNYGPGPALYLQVVTEVNGGRRNEIKPHDRPVHLAEGEFVGLIHDDRVSDKLKETAANGDVGEVELYYSYVSVRGEREPTNLSIEDEGDADCLFREMTADDQDPRTMELSVVRDECL